MPNITSGSGDIPVLSEVFGSTPGTVLWEDINLGDEQLRALRENLAAFPEIQQLGGQYYDYMLGMLNRSIPGFADILAQGGELTKKMQATAGEFLGGEVPQDVLNQVYRSSAFQSLGAGTMGSGMAGANTARNLGLTSLDMIQRGVGMQQAAGNAAQQWAGIASNLNMNPASFFISPQEQFAATTMNQIQRNAALQLEENKRAAPGAVAKGVSDTIINLIGAYLGAGKGGGGGGVAPNYGIEQMSGQSTGGIAGGTSLPFGGNYGGTNTYAATTGGWNIGGSNYGGQDIPYMGGSAFNATPYGSNYGYGR